MVFQWPWGTLATSLWPRAAQPRNGSMLVFVHVSSMTDDYYVFDEPSCRLVDRRSGRTFALGDSVKVEVQSVSVVRRKVDFALAGYRARHHGGPEEDRDHPRHAGRAPSRSCGDACKGDLIEARCSR